MCHDDVLARIDAALTEVDAAPLPDDTWWEREAGKWTAEPPAPPAPAEAPDEVVLVLSLDGGRFEHGIGVALARIAPALASIARYLELRDADPDDGPRGRGTPPLPYGRPGRAGQVSPYGPPGRTVRT